MSLISANLKVGSFLGLGAIGIYLFTMYHLKAQAPGDLEQMEPLPPSEKVNLIEGDPLEVVPGADK